MPHLQRAVTLRRRLQHIDMLGAAALEALDVLQHAILLLDQDCRLLHANASSDALVSQADGLGANRSLLFAATPTWTSPLNEVLRRAAGARGMPPRVGALRLPRAAGDALALLAMPFSHQAHWSLSAGPPSWSA